jgi:cytochrome c
MYKWNEQVRYSITVSDPNDGDSKYGEIPLQEVLLTLDFISTGKEQDIKKVTDRKEEKGLSLIKKSTCFGCHSHKAKLAGPSFEEISNRYEPNERTKKQLSDHILNGSRGVWGDQQMPAHPDFTEDQRLQIANFILQVKDQPYRWIYPGLEGTFRIMNKTNDDKEGIYVLTASYTSKSGVEGKTSVILKVK